MPRFFFHIFNDLVTHDSEGQELPDVASALAEARRGARALAAEQVAEQGRLALKHYIAVEDSGGAAVATVTFRDAIAIEG